MSKTYIASNQIRCTSCGGEPFSTHRYDFQPCECGKVAVDGGQDYLKRMGSCWEEMSIMIDKEALEQLVGAIDVSITTGRNPLGVTLAALRGIRDGNLVAVDHNGCTTWTTKEKLEVFLDSEEEH